MLVVLAVPLRAENGDESAAQHSFRLEQHNKAMVRLKERAQANQHSETTDTWGKELLTKICEGEKITRSIPEARLQKILAFFEFETFLIPELMKNENAPAAQAVIDAIPGLPSRMLFATKWPTDQKVPPLSEMFTSREKRLEAWGGNLHSRVKAWKPIPEDNRNSRRLFEDIADWLNRDSLGQSLKREIQFYSCPLKALKELRFRESPDFVVKEINKKMAEFWSSPSAIHSDILNRLESRPLKPMPIAWIVTADKVGPDFWTRVPVEKWADLAVGLQRLENAEREVSGESPRFFTAIKEAKKFIPEKVLHRTLDLKSPLAEFLVGSPYQHSQRFALAESLNPNNFWGEEPPGLLEVQQRLVKELVTAEFPPQLASTIPLDPRLIECLAPTSASPTIRTYREVLTRKQDHASKLSDLVAILPDEALEFFLERENAKLPSRFLKPKLEIQKRGLSAKDFKKLLASPWNRGDVIPLFPDLEADLQNAGIKNVPVMTTNSDLPINRWLDRKTLLKYLEDPKVARHLSQRNVDDYRINEDILRKFLPPAR